MGNYLRLYDNESRYIIDTNSHSTPNVVYCIGEDKAHYNDTIQDNTVIHDEREYIVFSDSEIEKLCVLNFGNYRQVVTVDNGDDTVTITEKYIRKQNTTIVQNTVLSTTTRTKTENDTAGTVNIPIGITYQQARAATAIANFADILGDLVYASITASFSTTVNIYGLKIKYKQKTADSPFINFATDTSHILKLNVYYMYYGYDSQETSGGGYIYVTNFPYNLGDNYYLTFFNDSYSSSRVNTYVNFTTINGYRPQSYVAGYVFAIINKNDI